MTREIDFGNPFNDSALSTQYESNLPVASVSGKRVMGALGAIGLALTACGGGGKVDSHATFAAQRSLLEGGKFGEVQPCLPGGEAYLKPGQSTTVETNNGQVGIFHNNDGSLELLGGGSADLLYQPNYVNGGIEVVCTQKNDSKPASQEAVNAVAEQK
jgi:hypothetical protein